MDKLIKFLILAMLVGGCHKTKDVLSALFTEDQVPFRSVENATDVMDMIGSRGICVAWDGDSKVKCGHIVDVETEPQVYMDCNRCHSAVGWRQENHGAGLDPKQNLVGMKMVGWTCVHPADGTMGMTFLYPAGKTPAIEFTTTKEGKVSGWRLNCTQEK